MGGWPAKEGGRKKEKKLSDRERGWKGSGQKIKKQKAAATFWAWGVRQRRNEKTKKRSKGKSYGEFVVAEKKPRKKGKKVEARTEGWKQKGKQRRPREVLIKNRAKERTRKIEGGGF